MSPAESKPSSADTKEGSSWTPTVGIWLLVLALTVATALYFKRRTPDAPLDAVSLALVAFFWFLLAFGVRWVWKRFHHKNPAG